MDSSDNVVRHNTEDYPIALSQRLAELGYFRAEIGCVIQLLRKLGESSNVSLACLSEYVLLNTYSREAIDFKLRLINFLNPLEGGCSCEY